MTSALFWIPFSIGAVLMAVLLGAAINWLTDTVVSKMGGGR